MSDYRCPNCENDLTDAVMAASIRRIRAGGKGCEQFKCPHCSEELQVAVALNITLERPAYAGSGLGV